MNKKGFTLIEILCVVTLLSVLAVIAATNVINSTNNSKEKLYCTKITQINTKAREYGKKYEKDIINSKHNYNGYKSITITINDLIKDGILIPDRKGNVISPLDDSLLNNKEIIIYLKNDIINSFIDTNNIC